ncbi:hypothetical protein [Clostridium sp. UBA7503]|uniref:hypothetical protein n=1 Tax=Clostridium sp. UBA7503 TaxID=1946377 RepID=UPI003216F5E2
MSIISGIFPSEIVDIDESGLPIYDRAVDEEYFAKYHSEFLSNGVYANPSNNFQVMVNDLMKLKVKAGSCFINGYYAYDNFDGEIILEPASSDLNRIDRIVTRLDRINRKISIEVKKGAYGTTSYSAPDLQRDDDIWELGLADVLVKKGTTQIVQANITDLRPIQEYCGYVYNPMQNIDTTDLFAQYNNSFEVWFQHVKDQLSTDAAGNLQKQIDTHTSKLEDFINFFNNGGKIGNLTLYTDEAGFQTIQGTGTHMKLCSDGGGSLASCQIVIGNDSGQRLIRPITSQANQINIGSETYPFRDVFLNGIGSMKNSIVSLQNKTVRISSRVINTVGTQGFDLGFKPKFLRIHATLKNKPDYDSDGVYNGVGYATLYRYGNGTLAGNSNTMGIIMLHSGNTYNRATCKFTDIGFNLIWEVYGALPEDTILMIIEALG